MKILVAHCLLCNDGAGGYLVRLAKEPTVEGRSALARDATAHTVLAHKTGVVRFEVVEFVPRERRRRKRAE